MGGISEENVSTISFRLAHVAVLGDIYVNEEHQLPAIMVVLLTARGLLSRYLGHYLLQMITKR